MTSAPLRRPDVRAPTARRDGGADPGRERWPDVAKGLCILLVVLWHVVIKHYQPVDWTVGLPVSAAWGVLDEQLMPVRMPLFFAVSGLFAARAVERPWRRLLQDRVLRFAALYAGWLLIHTAVLGLAPRFDTAHATDAGQLLAQLTISPTNLWYLLALALYSLIARLTRRVPAAVLLPAAFVLSAVAGAGLVPNENNRWQLLQNLLFFLVALRSAPAVEAFARSVRSRGALAIGLCFAVLLTGVRLLHAEAWFGAWPLLCLLGAALGIAVAAMLARGGGAADHLAVLGRRTLPIYVLHLPVLALLDLAMRPTLQRSAAGSLVVAVGEPVLATVVVVAACLLLHRLLLRLGLRRLFDPFPATAVRASPA